MTAHAGTDESGTDGPSVTNGLVEAALEIANKRANALREIEAHLLQGENDQALRLMKQFFGLDEQNAKSIQAGG